MQGLCFMRSMVLVCVVDCGTRCPSAMDVDDVVHRMVWPLHVSVVLVAVTLWRDGWLECNPTSYKVHKKTIFLERNHSRVNEWRDVAPVVQWRWTTRHHCHISTSQLHLNEIVLNENNGFLKKRTWDQTTVRPSFGPVDSGGLFATLLDSCAGGISADCCSNARRRSKQGCEQSVRLVTFRSSSRMSFRQSRRFFKDGSYLTWRGCWSALDDAVGVSSRKGKGGVEERGKFAAISRGMGSEWSGNLWEQNQEQEGSQKEIWRTRY